MTNFFRTSGIRLKIQLGLNISNLFLMFASPTQRRLTIFMEIICSIFKTYSGTPLIRSPVGQKIKEMAVLVKGWPYYRGRVRFRDLRAVMTNTPYMTFVLVVQLVLFNINNRNTRYRVP